MDIIKIINLAYAPHAIGLYSWLYLTKNDIRYEINENSSV